MSVVRWKAVLRILGFFLLALAVSLLAPLFLAILDADQGLRPLLVTALSAAVVGGALAWLVRFSVEEFNHRDGIVLVILTWVTAGVVGALPFYLSPFFSSFTDSFFESISGFTTTGATILTDIEALPRSLLLWRSFTHWLGGMGIILLGIAILPLIGAGGIELYRAEFSGARSEKIRPRIAETAAALWKVYGVLTMAALVTLWLAGMRPFDALCHTFSALGTGGFSTRNQSIEAFDSVAIEMVLIFFMFAAGINFTQHFRLMIERAPAKFLRDREIWFYSGLTAGAALLVGINRVWGEGAGVGEAARTGLFQVVSIVTTTGFSSANFELWPPFSQLVLLALMFAGGCTGSTAGGLKIARIKLLLRVVGREFRRMVERRGVFAVYSDGHPVAEQTIQSLLNLVYLAFLVNFGASVLLTMFGVDVLTAIAAVAASMFNIGPGLGDVGPADSYAHFSPPVKWILSICMLAGRLEFYTLFVVMTPVFWKK